MNLTKKTEKKLIKIAQRWNWENLEDKWTILEGAFCRLSWVLDGANLDEEYKDVLKDTSDLIEVLQTEIKTRF